MSGIIAGTAGTLCPKCGTVILRGQDIRRNSNKKWEHETCLTVVYRNPNPKRTKLRAQLTLV